MRGNEATNETSLHKRREKSDKNDVDKNKRGNQKFVLFFLTIPLEKAFLLL